MVNRGRPSRGCANCRKLHVKCDEKRPECSRCSRMKRACVGYRDELDLMFRHEDISSCRQSSISKRKEGKVISSSKSYQKPYDLSWTSQMNLLSQTLSSSTEDIALCFFYSSTLDNLPELDHTRYLHQQLPTMFSQSGSNSVLQLATFAISYAASATSGQTTGHTIRSSMERYVRAIAALNVAIRDPLLAKTDETLYAALLLSGYETMICNTETLQAWSSHVDGTAALLKLRDKADMHTPLSRSMFLFIRRNIVLSHMQTCRRIDPMFSELPDNATSYENAEDQLLSRAVHIPNLQSLAQTLLGIGKCSTEIEVLDLVESTISLDGQLSLWAKYIPRAWSYISSGYIQSSTQTEPSITNFAPNHLHQYQNVYVARVWNLYRVFRLIVQSIILRASGWLLNYSTLGKRKLDTASIERKSLELVLDICASVPFLLGFALHDSKQPNMKLSQRGDLWPQNSMAIDSTCSKNGRFSLVWPLHVAKSVPSIPEAQRNWMLEQLRWIGEDGGILQAALATTGASQILLGGAENFVFDCC